jgi:hypothetical protein
VDVDNLFPAVAYVNVILLGAEFDITRVEVNTLLDSILVSVELNIRDVIVELDGVTI